MTKIATNSNMFMVMAFFLPLSKMEELNIGLVTS